MKTFVGGVAYEKYVEKTPLFRPYIELFRGKKGIIHRNPWREQKDTIYPVRYGISPTDAIKESFWYLLNNSGIKPIRVNSKEGI